MFERRLATADDGDDGEKKCQEVSRVRLRYPKHLMSCTIALAHTLTPSHTVRCLDRDTAGDCIGRAWLSGVWLPTHSMTLFIFFAFLGLLAQYFSPKRALSP